MSTTTIRLPDELKERIARLAEGAGLTPHAFMLQAIEERAAEAEAQAAFEVEVRARWRELQRTGEHYTLEDMQSYARALVRGESVAAPPVRRGSAVARSGGRKRGGSGTAT